MDDEGFFKTGDIGHFNEAGALFVVDRKKELMNYKGFQVNPSEIENVIEKIEGVKQVAVVGILDPVVQNLVTAVVVKKQGFISLAEKEIVDFVAANLPEHKQIHGGVYFVDELPSTLSAKIKKREVVDMIVDINLKKKSENVKIVVQVAEETDLKNKNCCWFC